MFMQGKGQWLFFVFDWFHLKRFKTSLSLLKKNIILLKFTVLKQNYSGLYILRIVKIFWEKKKLLIFGNLFFFMEEKKKSNLKPHRVFVPL